MRFLFVDAISAIESDRIVGRHHFEAASPMRFPTSDGDCRIAAGAVCEAIGQLASWCCLARNDFAMRQVFIFARSIDVLRPVRPGETVELEVAIHAMDQEAFRYSGEARVSGQTVQRLSDCSGFFMPLAELEDPDTARRRFAAMQSTRTPNAAFASRDATPSGPRSATRSPTRWALADPTRR